MLHIDWYHLLSRHNRQCFFRSCLTVYARNFQLELTSVAEKQIKYEQQYSNTVHSQ